MEEYIQTGKAAEIAEVTNQTIRNLCKEGVVKYKRKGKMFFPLKSDIEKLGDRVKVFEKEQVSLDNLILDIREQKDKLIQLRNDNDKALAEIGMYPARIGCLDKLLRSVVENFYKASITPREYQIIIDKISGVDIETMQDYYGLSRLRIRQVWEKALRHVELCKNVITSKDEEIAELKDRVAKLEDKIINSNKGVKYSAIERLLPLLRTNIRETDLSVRAKNGLLCSEVETVYDLVVRSKEQIMRCRNFGRKSLIEVDAFLEANGIDFNMVYLKQYEDIIKGVA